MGKQGKKAGPREFSSNPVSVQRGDTNLGQLQRSASRVPRSLRFLQGAGVGERLRVSDRSNTLTNMRPQT
jgi:hypothetical protein